MAQPCSIDDCIKFAERNAEIYNQASIEKNGEERVELKEKSYKFSMISELLKDLKIMRKKVDNNEDAE